ncbi:MAG: ribosomal protein S18-alanine N-acetyltransferase [Methylophilaceae bacterium]
MNICNKINFYDKEDLDEIVNIENKSHLTPWTKKNFTDADNANNLFKVLKSESNIIGYYIALFAAEECQLLNITVRLELKKKGFGQLMLKNLVEECRKKNIINIFLEVRASNSSAIRLYEKNGFNEIGIRKNYYKVPDGQEDAILMGLSL